MRIRRFAPRRSDVVKPNKPKSTLPDGSFRVEFFCQTDDGFPSGEWFAAVLFPDRVEYYRMPLTGYQTVNRLVSRFGDAERVDGKIIYDLVTGGDIKIMSLTNLRNTSD